MEKEFLTYAEYKLYCLMNNKKPLEKKEVGIFVKSEDIERKHFIKNDDSSSCEFTTNEIETLVNLLCDNVENSNNFKEECNSGFTDKFKGNAVISPLKLVEMSRKLGVDEKGVLSIFDILQKNELTKEDLTQFLSYFN